ncbi:FAS1 domain-containing protein SELMODRAFT_448915-like [Macadamia integrifolia]|uniref:FAS1 domain-containing protein SELMODRAFT_448915-like n=1 Tax=Macadamia integrifolia TaxID=60698 RepID=UPI001C529D9E|nr:FAS1 domain-containing protein SELMODRAFT_448915-like [Macadamia integrifolia]
MENTYLVFLFLTSLFFAQSLLLSLATPTGSPPFPSEMPVAPTVSPPSPSEMPVTPTTSPPSPSEIPATHAQNIMDGLIGADMSVTQVQNIIEALIGAEDFHSWADVFATTDPSTFPMTATLFIPINNDPVDDLDPSSSILYHVVPHVLTFKDLQKLATGSRLPTLLRGKSILVTNNSSSKFSIDDCLITHPDLVVNGAFCVHGIGSMLNYTAYGAEPLKQSPPHGSSHVPGGFSPPAAGESVGVRQSDAAPYYRAPFIFSILAMSSINWEPLCF